MSNILISIIIPTYKDWNRLSLCTEALSKQTFSKEMFEIIIVNNNSHDTVPSGFILPDNGKLILEKKPGSYAARNAALRIAKGDIIGFTDSDCIPDENWIKYAADYFTNNPKCSRIAGKVSIFCKSATSKIEIYDKLYAFHQKIFVINSGTSVTANLFTYKHVFDKVGYFDETLMSGGDFLWGMMANKQGYKVEYVEDVVVGHPARDTLKELLIKEKRVGEGQAKFLNDKNLVLSFLNFLKELRPRVSDIIIIYTNGKKLTIKDKIYIYLLRQYLVSTRAYTKLKIHMHSKKIGVS